MRGPRPLAWLVTLAALCSGGCASAGSLGRAQSLWRNREAEALEHAREAAARSTDPVEALAARRLACRIGLELGNPGEAASDYVLVREQRGQDDWTLLRPLCFLVLEDALGDWSVDRRRRAAACLGPLEDDEWLSLVAERACRDPSPEVKLALTSQLVLTSPSVGAPLLRLLITEQDPRLRAAAALAMGERLQRRQGGADAKLRDALWDAYEDDAERSVQVAALRALCRAGDLERLTRRADLRLRDPATICAFASEAARIGQPGAWSEASAWVEAQPQVARAWFLKAPWASHPSRWDILREAAAARELWAAALIREALEAGSTPADLSVALEAAGRSGAASLTPLVAAACEHPFNAVRGVAWIALARLDPAAAQPWLTRASPERPELAAQALAARAAAGLSALELCEAARAQPEAHARVVAAALSARGDEGRERLVELACDLDPRVRAPALARLAASDDVLAREALQSFAEAATQEDARPALKELLRVTTQLESDALAGPLTELLLSGDAEVDVEAAAALIIISRRRSGARRLAGS